MKRIATFIYIFLLIAFVVYSYSQIDLNLTLSQSKPYQDLQELLIQLGYFNRPLSTIIYIFLMILLTVFYIYFLRQVRKSRFKKIELSLLILGVGLVVLFAYPAFSHDIFNYMFDARIITKYGLNPYDYKALDFPYDLWTRFMHWTHRTYPYGPLWIILTVPFSVLGLTKFTLTLVNFKLLFLTSYYLNSFLIYKIYNRISPNNSLYAAAFFAFNPLIIIETVASPHNDSVMLTFALFSILLLFKKKYIFSLLTMFASGAIKFITLSFIPIIIISYFCKFSEDKKGMKRVLTGFLLLSLMSTSFAAYSRELLPWYAIVPLGIASLLSTYKIVQILTINLSLGLLYKYVSFLYKGEWTSQDYYNYLVIFLIMGVVSLLYFVPISRVSIFKFKL